MKKRSFRSTFVSVILVITVAISIVNLAVYGINIKKIRQLPMLWGRSGYAGSHTIPAAWAGDSSTHLNNHACILRGGLSAAMSGIPFWGFDMGGFYNTDHEGYECVPTDLSYRG